MFRLNRARDKGGAQVKAPKRGWKIDLRSLNWRKVTVVLVVLAVVVIGGSVTAGFLMRDRDSGPDTERPLEDMSDEERRRAIEADKKYAIASLTEIYTYRGVKTEEIIDEEVNRTNEYGGSWTEVARSCVKVVGLKDNAVEEKINSELKAAYDRAVVEEYQGGKRVVRCKVGANFGGVFSVTVDVWDMTTYKAVEVDYGRLTWRLDTGESVKFDDLFLKGTNIAMVVETAVYNWWEHESKRSWCGSGLGGFSVGEGEDHNLWYKKFNGKNTNLEECLAYARDQVGAEEVGRAVLMYRDNPDLRFSVDSRSLDFLVNGRLVHLQWESIWDRVAFYKRFEREGLIAEGSEIDSFVFADLFLSVEQEAENLIIARVARNNYLSVTNYYDIPEKITTRFRGVQETALAEIKDYAARHPDKMIFVFDQGADNCSGLESPYRGTDGQPSWTREGYRCRLGIDVYEAEFGEPALQDIAAGYRMYRPDLFIYPHNSWGDDSRWTVAPSNPQIPGSGIAGIPSVEKTLVEISPAGDVVYWGPQRE